MVRWSYLLQQMSLPLLATKIFLTLSIDNSAALSVTIIIISVIRRGIVERSALASLHAMGRLVDHEVVLTRDNLGVLGHSYILMPMFSKSLCRTMRRLGRDVTIMIVVYTNTQIRQWMYNLYKARDSSRCLILATKNIEKHGEIMCDQANPPIFPGPNALCTGSSSCSGRLCRLRRFLAEPGHVYLSSMIQTHQLLSNYFT